MALPDPLDRVAAQSARPIGRRWRLLVGIVVFVVVAGALRNALGIEWSTDGLRGVVANAGVWAPVIFITLMVFRLLLAIPSILLLPAGGLLFGTLEGSIYGTIGLTLSGLLNFGLVRYAGPESLRARISPGLGGILEIARSRFGVIAVAVISAYPIGPITAAHLGAAVAGMGILSFGLAVALGSLVRATTFSLFGASLVESGQLVWASIALVGALVIPLLIPRSREWLVRSFGLGPRAALSPEDLEDPDTGRDT